MSPKFRMQLIRTLFTKPKQPTIATGLLPIELLQAIFSHLAFLDLVCCRLVCRLWTLSIPPSSSDRPSRPYTVTGAVPLPPPGKRIHTSPHDNKTREFATIVDEHLIPRLVIGADCVLKAGKVIDDGPTAYECDIVNLTGKQIGKWNGDGRLNPMLLELADMVGRLVDQKKNKVERTRRPQFTWKLWPDERAPEWKFKMPSLKTIERKRDAESKDWHDMYISLPPASRIKVGTSFASGLSHYRNDNTANRSRYAFTATTKKHLAEVVNAT